VNSGTRALPSLIRFLVAVAVLAGLVYAGLFALANFVKVKPREITQTIQLPKPSASDDNSSASGGGSTSRGAANAGGGASK